MNVREVTIDVSEAVAALNEGKGVPEILLVLVKAGLAKSLRGEELKSAVLEAFKKAMIIESKRNITPAEMLDVLIGILDVEKQALKSLASRFIDFAKKLMCRS